LTWTRGVLAALGLVLAAVFGYATVQLVNEHGKNKRQDRTISQIIKKVGPVGPPGPEGAPGEPGSVGVLHFTTTVVVKGHRGPPGKNGKRGKNGRTVTGPRGEKGPEGPPGQTRTTVVHHTEVIVKSVTVTVHDGHTTTGMTTTTRKKCPPKNPHC
jgi:hypothetical protein